MTLRLFLYALWCAAVIALFALTGTFAWSPFADGGRERGYGVGGGGHGYYGPHHK